MAGYGHPPARVLMRCNRSGTVICRRAAQRGIALMLVLWILALLTIIAVGLTAAQRTESALARNQLAAARFDAAADAAISWAVLNLLAPATAFEDEEVDPWVPDGSARPWSFAGETLEIRVFNEASRIDLNKAPRDLLEDLLSAAGLAADEASALADAIEDWRDRDDLTGLNGAEDDDYENAGRSYGAKDGPFDSVEELQLVLGVDQALYRTLAPALTVDSNRAKPDMQFAPLLVQAALQGTTLEELKKELEARAEPVDSNAVVVARGGPIYRIRVTRVIEGAAGPSMEALVRVEPGKAQPFSVLWRRFGLGAEAPIATTAEKDEDAGKF